MSEDNALVKFDSLGRRRRLCKAHRKDGSPCQALAVAGLAVCRKHGGSTKRAREAAQRNIALAAPYAAKVVQELAAKGKNESVRLAAAKDILDRNQIGTDKKVGLEVQVTKFEQVFAGLLVDIEVKDDDIVDAEVVEADEPPALPSAPVRRRRAR